MSKTILGLDIREEGVSAVLLKSGLKGSSLSGFAAATVPQEADPGEALDRALTEIGEKLDLAGSDCVAGLPDHLVSYRNLSLPFTDDRKIRQVLPLELEGSLPFPVDQVVMDFYPLRAGDQTELTAAVLDGEALAHSLALLEAAAMTPEIVSAGGFSLAFCLSERGEAGEQQLLIDIGTRHGQVTLLMAGKIRLFYPFRTGEIVTADDIQVHVERALAAFEAQSPEDFIPERVLVSGVAAADPVWQAELANALDIPVEGLDLRRRIPGLVMDAAADGWDPFRFDRALALALAGTSGKAGLNFRRGAFAPRRKWAEHRKTLIRLGVLALVVLVLGAVDIGLDVYFMNQRRSALDAEITAVFKSTFPEVTRIVDPLQQMRVKLADLKKTLFLPGDAGGALLNIDILNALSTLIPPETDVELTQLVMGPENVLISGNTNTFNTVDDIKNRLERQPDFKEVTISSANMEKSGKRVRFKLKIQL